MSREIAAATHAAAHAASSGLITLIERCWKSGPMREQPFPFVASSVESSAGATMDSMMSNPKNTDGYCGSGFDALWRAIG